MYKINFITRDEIKINFITGKNGLTAYGLAIQEGFEGTLEEWLLSLVGNDGKEIELQKSETHIQWRYVGDLNWIDLVSLADLKGAKGDAGEDITAINDATTSETTTWSSTKIDGIVGDILTDTQKTLLTLMKLSL